MKRVSVRTAVRAAPAAAVRDKYDVRLGGQYPVTVETAIADGARYRQLAVNPQDSSELDGAAAGFNSRSFVVAVRSVIFERLAGPYDFKK